jgi:adenylate cyclase
MTPMTDIVFAHGGTLDKYIGDAVMAFWGAPVSRRPRGVLACKAALQDDRKVHVLNKEFRSGGCRTSPSVSACRAAP